MTILRVFRYAPEKGEPRFVDYEVALSRGATVLDALFWIKHQVDGSLTFRSSCRSAICGSCAMTVNDQNRLACKTQLSEMGRVVKVEPLVGYPVIKDLVVDMDLFWRQYRDIQPYLISKSPPPEREWLQSPEERRILDDPARCIMCGACSSSCPVIWTDERYLGPAALLKVWRFIADSRDDAVDERLDMVSTEFGVWRCHTIFRCVDSCPKEINPTEAIESLRRAAVKRALRRAFGRRREEVTA
jgi:succinate dehydrogenase / fumarate reductase iron-sulfur subunit